MFIKMDKLGVQLMGRSEKIIDEIINIDTSIDQLKMRWDVLNESEIGVYEELEERKHCLLQSLISHYPIKVE